MLILKIMFIILIRLYNIKHKAIVAEVILHSEVNQSHAKWQAKLIRQF